MNNKYRKEIYDLIKKNPSISISKIKEELNLGNYVTIWNINVLEKFDFIKIEKFNNKRIIFSIDQDRDLAILYYLINQKDIIKNIFLLLLKKPSKVSEISKFTNNKRELVIYYLKKLSEFGYIFLKLDVKKTYQISPDSYELINKIFQNYI